MGRRLRHQVPAPRNFYSTGSTLNLSTSMLHKIAWANDLKMHIIININHDLLITPMTAFLFGVDQMRHPMTQIFFLKKSARFEGIYTQPIRWMNLPVWQEI